MVSKLQDVLRSSQRDKKLSPNCLFYGIFRDYFKKLFNNCSTEKDNYKPLWRESVREVFVLFVRKFYVNNLSNLDFLLFQNVRIYVCGNSSEHTLKGGLFGDCLLKRV